MINLEYKKKVLRHSESFLLFILNPPFFLRVTKRASLGVTIIALLRANERLEQFDPSCSRSLTIWHEEEHRT